MSNNYNNYSSTHLKRLFLQPGMTNYRIKPHRTTSDYIGPHRTTSDHIGLHLTKSDKTAQRRRQRPLTSCIPVVNHVLAHSRKCLTYMTLEENPLFHAAAIQIAERVPSGLQRSAYWELYCFTDCWRHYATDDLGLILLLWRHNL